MSAILRAGLARPQPTVFRTKLNLGALLLALSLTSCGQSDGDASAPSSRAAQAPGEQPRLVLLYIACTLNKDFLSPYASAVGFTPRVEEFARKGRVFRRHVTECGQSGVDFATIFTGTQADRHGIYDHPNHLHEKHELIAESFAAAGYETHFWSGHLMATPYLGYGQGVSEENVVSQERIFQNSSKPFPRAYLQNLAATDEKFHEILQHLRRNPEARAFVQVAFTVSHEPYHRYAPIERVLSFLERHPGVAPGITRTELQRWLPLYEEHRFALNWDLAATSEELGLSAQDVLRLAATLEVVYATCIRQLDGFFGRLLHAVDAAGLGPSSLIAFTTDHGESLYRENALFNWTHGPQIPPEVLDIPLIVRGAGLPPGSYEGVTRTIDIFPTLAGLAGVPIPSSVEGIDLTPALRGLEEAPELLAFSHSPLWPESQVERFAQYELVHTILPGRDPEFLSVRVRERDLVLKIMRTRKGGFAQEAFDLASDPGETNNLFDPADPRHARLMSALQAYKERLVAGFDPSASTIEATEGLEQLRALGYR